MTNQGMIMSKLAQRQNYVKYRISNQDVVDDCINYDNIYYHNQKTDLFS